MCTYLQPARHLPLLADDGRVVVEGDVMEQRLQEHVGNTNQVVILLRLVEWIQSFIGRFLVIKIVTSLFSFFF